ncbi:MAG: universal stress protein [Cenarchaeum symbiont of Oopsacas minuta]|nr:universal stress protein [Cenarchaeum symbiont of Oopsacas minuta]
MKHKKILVPIDDSKNSWRSIDHAIVFAKETGAKITILYVVPTIQESEFRSSGIDKRAMKMATNVVERVKAYAARKGIVFKTRVDHGHVGYCIIKHAHSKKHNFDLLIIGSRGKGRIRKMIFGSTSNYVISESRLPVLVVK